MLSCHIIQCQLGIERFVRPTLKSAASRLVALSTIVLGLAVLAAASDGDPTDSAKRLKASADVLNQIMSSTDKNIPPEVLSEAKCIAVIPSLVKVALGVGGRHGKGMATCRTRNGWSAPGPINISGGSIGLQIGSQTVDMVLIILDEHAFTELLSSKFKIGGDVAGSPGPVGKQSSVNDWHKAEILMYSKSHGVFAGVNLKGAAVKQDKDSTVELYGRYIPIGSILAGKVPPPAESHEFLAVVRKYVAEARHS